MFFGAPRLNLDEDKRPSYMVIDYSTRRFGLDKSPEPLLIIDIVR
jgi:hypothetical protein